jgi:hypothetical protein
MNNIFSKIQRISIHETFPKIPSILVVKIQSVGLIVKFYRISMIAYHIWKH